MVSFYHIINPYRAPIGSESARVQERTLESLSVASAFSQDVINVRYLIRADPDDGDLGPLAQILPNQSIQPLTRFSFDVGNFAIQRRLPLLSDMFAVEVPTNADCYVIFTNMDICVTPYFYTECARLLLEGSDCMVINRRTVDKRFLDLPLTEGFTSASKDHPGHDCFIFPASFLRKANLPDSILGIGYVFRPLLLNCILHFGERFREHRDFHLTIHFGDDMEWKDSRYADYLEYNKTLLVNTWRGFADERTKASTNLYVAGQFQKHFPFSFLK